MSRLPANLQAPCSVMSSLGKIMALASAMNELTLAAANSLFFHQSRSTHGTAWPWAGLSHLRRTDAQVPKETFTIIEPDNSRERSCVTSATNRVWSAQFRSWISPKPDFFEYELTLQDLHFSTFDYNCNRCSIDVQYVQDIVGKVSSITTKDTCNIRVAMLLGILRAGEATRD